MRSSKTWPILKWWVHQLTQWYYIVTLFCELPITMLYACTSNSIVCLHGSIYLITCVLYTHTIAESVGLPELWHVHLLSIRRTRRSLNCSIALTLCHGTQQPFLFIFLFLSQSFIYFLDLDNLVFLPCCFCTYNLYISCSCNTITSRIYTIIIDIQYLNDEGGDRHKQYHLGYSWMI